MLELWGNWGIAQCNVFSGRVPRFTCRPSLQRSLRRDAVLPYRTVPRYRKTWGNFAIIIWY